MQVTKVLGLAAVGALLALAAPAERAQALSLSNPGAAAAVQQDVRPDATEVRSGGTMRLAIADGTVTTPASSPPLASLVISAISSRVTTFNRPRSSRVSFRSTLSFRLAALSRTAAIAARYSYPGNAEGASS